MEVVHAARAFSGQFSESGTRGKVYLYLNHPTVTIGKQKGNSNKVYRNTDLSVKHKIPVYYLLH